MSQPLQIYMASSTFHHLLLFFFFLFFFSTISFAAAGKAFRPRALVLPVSKDPSSPQYLTHISQRTPLVPLKLTLDLGGQFLWVDCDQGYASSTYKPVRCGSALCKLAESGSCGDCAEAPKPGCNRDACSLLPDNTVTGTGTGGEVAQDALYIQSTDCGIPGKVVSVPRFPFTCSATFLLQGLANGVVGMAGLGWTAISLPPQLSSAFSFPKKFAVCLSSSHKANGVVFFGDLPHIDVSKSLLYTPLIKNPVSTASSYFGDAQSSDYFIGVKSIQINGKNVPLNKTLLSINKNDGYGGTKISTVNPYTVMQTSIYKAIIKTFIEQLVGVPRVKAVAPFGLCYSSKRLGSSRIGPPVPVIDLVFQSKSVHWGIFGSNSMVSVSESVTCLGFVDGGENPRTSIVIGGRQIEDNLLQFDLGASKLGFSSSLLLDQTTCANFMNFTSHEI